MRILVVILVVLLVGTNAAWLVVRGERPPPARAPEPTQQQRAAEIRELRQTVEGLRAQLESRKEPASHPATSEPQPATPTATREPQPVKQAATPEPQPSASPPQKDLRQEAWTLSETWVKDALQLKDAAKRAAAIEEVRAALSSTDPVRQLAALLAFPQIGQLNFDKASFRPLILPLLESTAPGFRRSAIYALYQTGAQPGDLELILSIADDPGIQESITHAIFLFSKGQITGAAADAVLKVLASDDPRVKREGMRGIWGATASPEVQARLIEIAQDPQMRSDAIYFGLSTLANKSEAVVDVLVDAAMDPNFNIYGRARWGLTYGITSPEAQAKAADLFLELLKNDARNAEDALRVLGMYGTAKHLEAMEELARAPDTPDALRKRIDQAAARLRLRLRG